jgi:hypothetical protein
MKGFKIGDPGKGRQSLRPAEKGSKRSRKSVVFCTISSPASPAVTALELPIQNQEQCEALLYEFCSQ